MLQQLIIDHIDLWTSAETSRSTAGRGSNGKTELTGIKKLRELILELAVRGLLVSQDPNDEPASVLLAKIAAKKEALIKAGKLKKQKPLPAIADDEKPFELPKGWEWARFPDIGHYKTGKTPSTKNSIFWSTSESDIPWVSIADMTHFGFITDTNKKITQQARDQVFKYEPIPAGSLLMSFKLTVGKISILDVDAFHNEAIISIQPFDGVSKEYLFNFLPNRALAGNTKSAIKGNTLNSESLALIVIPLPPLAEQHRIVAKVDELMALCDQLEQQQLQQSDTHHTLVTTLLDSLRLATDNAQFQAIWSQLAAHFDTLFTTEASIDQLKQTLLQLAVMGKLVPQDPNDEPASVLLEKIAAEKEALIKTGKIKKQKPLPEITEDEKPFELPNGWEIFRLNNAIDVRDGTHDSPKDSNDIDSYPLVTSKDFSEGEIDFESARRISAIDHLEISKRSLVEVEDILFSMIGGNIGNQVMVKDERPFSVKNVALFKYYDKQSTSPYFIKKYLENLAFNLQSKASGGAQPFVSLGVLRNLIIALPPLAEQHRIVAKVDELMALCDQLKAGLNQAQTTQQQLAHALVEQAIQ